MDVVPELGVRDLLDRERVTSGTKNELCTGHDTASELCALSLLRTVQAGSERLPVKWGHRAWRVLLSSMSPFPGMYKPKKYHISLFCQPSGHRQRSCAWEAGWLFPTFFLPPGRSA
jgi:hypothetical protein